MLTVKDLSGFPDNLGQEEERQASCSNPFINRQGAVYMPLSTFDEDDIYTFLKARSLLLINVKASEVLNVLKTLCL